MKIPILYRGGPRDGEADTFYATEEKRAPRFLHIRPFGEGKEAVYRRGRWQKIGVWLYHFTRYRKSRPVWGSL